MSKRRTAEEVISPDISSALLSLARGGVGRSLGFVFAVSRRCVRTLPLTPTRTGPV